MNDVRGSRWLVTGASGFIGANLARTGVNAGADVHGLIRPGSRLDRLHDIVDRMSFHRADLTDAGELARAVRAADPQFVFHLGMTSGHAETPDGRRQMLLTSALGTFNLLDAMSTVRPERIVHVGGGLEYGSSPAPLAEIHPLGPSTFRGCAKAMATLLCSQAADAGLPVVTLRAFSVYGPWEPPARIVPSAIRAALEGRPFPLTRGCRRDFVFVDDVVEACVRAAHAAGAAGSVINIGTGVETANEDLVAAVEEVTGRRIQLAPGRAAPSPVDASQWVADISGAARLLQWHPVYSLRAGLLKSVAWHRERVHA